MLRQVVLLASIILVASQSLLVQVRAEDNVESNNKCEVSSQDTARLIIMFNTIKDRQNPQLLDQVANVLGQQQLQILRVFQDKGLIVCTEAGSQKQLNELIANLEQLNAIKYVEPDLVMKPLMP